MEQDLLARWGGEEFVILLPLSDVSMAERFAEKLRGAIATLPFDHGKSVTCSFGVAQLAAGESAERLVARADEALYRAKRNGRNRVELASKLSENESESDLRPDHVPDVGRSDGFPHPVSPHISIATKVVK